MRSHPMGDCSASYKKLLHYGNKNYSSEVFSEWKDMSSKFNVKNMIYTLKITTNQMLLQVVGPIRWPENMMS